MMISASIQPALVALTAPGVLGVQPDRDPVAPVGFIQHPHSSLIVNRKRILSTHIKVSPENLRKTYSVNPALCHLLSSNVKQLPCPRH
eukprot:scaffold206102_cov35-Attheya_sp.AAC.1